MGRSGSGLVDAYQSRVYKDESSENWKFVLPFLHRLIKYQLSTVIAGNGCGEKIDKVQY
jgi:hypothetical protein